MKKLMILAVAAIAMVGCAKTYDISPADSGKAISMGTWTGTMTKAPLTSFAVNSEFDVFGYKWKGTLGSQTDPTTVFDGVDVKQTSASVWEYAGINSQQMRYWDPSFAGYTFFAAYPKDILTTAPPQTGQFVTNELTFDGENENLLIAQQKNVERASFGDEVELHFKHCGALIDFKFKKHTDLTNAAVTVTSFSLANIQTKGKFTVDSYDSVNDYNPVGAEVSGIAGLGWSLAATPVVNSASAPYVMASSASSAAAATAAVDLIPSLVVMPQVVDDQTFTIGYTITDESSQTNTYAPVTLNIADFDKIENTGNEDAKFPAWMPGVHYTYTIIINANKIVFSASIESWVTEGASGYYYLIN